MLSNILQDYHEQKEHRRLFLKALQKDMRKYLKESDVRFVDIPYRVKGETSLSRKVHMNPNLFREINDVHDVCGMRVITYLRKDIEIAFETLKNRYEVTKVENREPQDPTKFGYASHHGRISFKDTSENYKKFEGLYAEIQVRTILQHAWAEIEHDLGYKNDIGIPPHLRRRFSLLAGLLEIGDREFDELRIAIGEYIGSLDKKTISDWAKIAIDTHSLAYFCDNSELLIQAAGTIRKSISAIKSDEHDYLPNVAALEYLNISNLEDLKELLSIHYEITIKVAAHHLAMRGAELPLANADVLDYLALTVSANMGFDKLRDLLKQIFSSGSAPEDNAHALEIFSIYKKITETF
jgi:putative GTP pyrophosphokinase